MAVERRYIDLEQHPDLVKLLETMPDESEPIVVRKDGRAIAVISPVERSGADESERKLSEDDIERFRSIAGSWVGLVDVDELQRSIEESRRLPNRTLPEL